jgi:dienelactone hydrolase
LRPIPRSACIVNHPSFVAIQSDLDKLVTPTYVLVGDVDDLMSLDEINQVSGILTDKLGEQGKVKVYHGAVHGFTVRGDDMVEEEKKQKEDAAAEAMKFIKSVFNISG